TPRPASDGDDTVVMPSARAPQAPASGDHSMAPTVMASHGGSAASDHTGEVSGTPGYMSPEQVTGAEQDHRTDIFAFGCVLFECLSGARAFSGPTAYETMMGTLVQDVDIKVLPERTPPPVRELLELCLQKDAEKRLGEIRTARHAIEEVLGIRRAAALRAGERPETPNNLPSQLTSFVGRAAELERCEAELGTTRLLTLLGMGGSGKTRIALRLAETVLDAYPDGVWFVDLNVLSDPERVVETVAEATGTREEPGVPIEKTLTGRLRDHRALIVMDNCEDVLDGVRPLATRLLAACEGLRILATSREALGVKGETVHAVPPLSVPTGVADEDPAATEAVQLFAARAAAARADFELTREMAEVVAEICRRLDGIPLALELAAARVRVLGVEQILARLGDRFKLLTAGKGAEGRHQTLRAAIQWSVDQLEEEELRLFRGLSVFVGSWALESAVMVTGDKQDEFEVLDALQRLADRSLVVLGRDAKGDARYRYLESVRQLAIELRDAAGEADAHRDRHEAWFMAEAIASETRLTTKAQRDWLIRLDPEHEDVLAAHDWALGRPDGIENALAIAAAMARYWSIRGHYRLARRTLHESLERAAGTTPTPEYAMASVRLAGFALYEGDYDAGRPLLERSLALYRQWKDEKGVARALAGLGSVAHYQRDYKTARACAEESLAWYRAQGNTHAVAMAVHNLGELGLLEGDHESARRHYEEAARIFEEGGDQRYLSHTLSQLALAHARLGDASGARPYLLKALAIARELGAHRESLYGLEAAAEMAARESDPARALSWLEGAAQWRETIGSPLLPVEVEDYGRLRGSLEERLGQPAARSAIDRGRSLSSEAALDEVTQWLGSLSGV
ncbi:MAG TPA: tetratricopeptide repeat protein, partial [Candidatus Eisenbacteria bacterium]|nr:tetratricopeptide repeat protein [Candidatus Eisenbacteria bacterium]